MFSIVATETSVLTFISIPGLAYRDDWFFLQLALGYIIGRILVAIFLLPQYFKGNINSIYEVLGLRFSPFIQKSASAIFLITRKSNKKYDDSARVSNIFLNLRFTPQLHWVFGSMGFVPVGFPGSRLPSFKRSDPAESRVSYS